MFVGASQFNVIGVGKKIPMYKYGTTGYNK